MNQKPLKLYNFLFNQNPPWVGWDFMPHRMLNKNINFIRRKSKSGLIIKD